MCAHAQGVQLAVEQLEPPLVAGQHPGVFMLLRTSKDEDTTRDDSIKSQAVLVLSTLLTTTQNSHIYTLVESCRQMALLGPLRDHRATASDTANLHAHNKSSVPACI